MLKLYHFASSSASHRVRIALRLKQLDHELVSVDLLKKEQFSEAFSASNPAHLVPVLEHEGKMLSQSLAIIEYLEERFVWSPRLLPTDPVSRARVRAFAMAIACDVQPLNNLRVRRHLSSALQQSEAQRRQWSRHWIDLSFSALESQLSRESTVRNEGFCFGPQPGFAECLLIPQITSAEDIGLDMSPYPLLCVVGKRCAELDAFRLAHPAAQSSAPRH